MATRGLLIPSSYLPYIFNAAAAVSAVPIVAGAVIVANPAAGLAMLNFAPLPPQQQRDATELTHGLLRMYAVRQAAMGLATLAMWWTGSRRALGLTMLSGWLVAGVDGLVAKQITGEHVAGHWVGVGLSLFFGPALLEWI